MKRLIALLLVMLMLTACAHADGAPVRLADPDGAPQTLDSGFLAEGEAPVYYRSHADGRWLYISDNTRVDIRRVQSQQPLLTYYIADLTFDSSTAMYTAAWNEERPGRTNGLPQDIAARVNAVFAMSGDFYSYRVANDRYPGHIVRDGKILYKKSYSKKVNAVPNLATIALYPSGKAEVNEAHEKTAKEYVDQGAHTVMAFGPILIRDGEVQDLSDKAYRHDEPRLCMGIVSRGHYIVLLVEGRNKHSGGADLETCAEILFDLGCWDAINLDGGNTAAMLFMGESVQMTDAGGVAENTRSIPDVLCLGVY